VGHDHPDPNPIPTPKSHSTLTFGASLTVFVFGLPAQVSTSTPSMTSLVHVATGSATALGVPVMANTPTVPAAKHQPILGRISRYLAGSH
jgi:hypothetical protein